MMAGCVVPSSGRHCKHTDGEMVGVLEGGGGLVAVGETPDNYLKSGDWIQRGPSAPGLALSAWRVRLCSVCRTSRGGRWVEAVVFYRVALQDSS